ncbi:unnamed protein product [Arctogadus glacialis]
MGTSCWLRSPRRCAATPSNKCVNAAYSPPATTKEPKDSRLSPLNLLLTIAQGPCFVFSLSHRTQPIPAPPVGDLSRRYLHSREIREGLVEWGREGWLDS